MSTPTDVGISESTLEAVLRPVVTHPLEAGRPGLGLPIVHDVVDPHDGSLDLASEEEEGTVVTFTLPVRSVHPAEEVQRR